MNTAKHLSKIALIPALALGLAACSDNDDDLTTKEFQVSIINLSNNQPMSPVALILHQSDYSGWTLSEAATNGLEVLAEGGDNSAFIAEAQANDTEFLASSSSEGILAPGASTSLTVTTQEVGVIEMTLATMLVNTNDAFTGSTGISLTSMTVGQEVRYNLPVYDAGTEFNSELAGTIPGPADGGEGFNSTRDDTADQVTRHSGVVGANVDGGLDENPLSALDESHKFDAPIARIVVTRTN